MTTVADGLRFIKAGASTPLGYQQITSLSASTALTVPAGSKMALIECEGTPVRWRDDGTAPTATIGMTLETTDVFEYSGSLSAIRFIQTAASATLNISYYS